MRTASVPAFPHQYPQPLAGVDEVGRGPLAGPVAAAAVVLHPGQVPAGIRDSKALSARQRQALDAALRAQATVALGIATVEEIDRLNILEATLLAMRRAVAALPLVPAFVRVDGNRVPAGLPCPAEAVVRGDAVCMAIAAASIVAKVARDAIMAELADQCPGYGWERNAGYASATHRAAILRLGPTVHHRALFIRNVLAERAAQQARSAMEAA